MVLQVKRLFLLVPVFAVVAFFAFKGLESVYAEQSGGSPSSGSNSRLTTLDLALESLGYGSTSSGSWGDWGTSWNRIYSAAINPVNAISSSGGIGNGGSGDYPKSKGGVDDYNNGGGFPDDSYRAVWTTCSVDNDYCGTGRSVARFKDENTGLVWSPRTTTTTNWFQANNCKYPNGLSGDDGVCDLAGEVACICVKDTLKEDADNTPAKTCERYDDENWRLPTQKELMMAYIDGSRYIGLIDNTEYYWSSTTYTVAGAAAYRTAWQVHLVSGLANGGTKTAAIYAICVR